MQKYFDLLLELLRPEDDDYIIEEKKKLSATAHRLEERWNTDLLIAHRYGFIFEAYEDLLNEKISLDEFLATWDITSNRKLHTNNQSSIDVISSIINWQIKANDNTLFILDSISFWRLADNDKKIIQSRAKNHNCELIFC